MCGIFGVVNREDAGEIVFEGLKALEYRGYDSWGIAWKEERSLKVEKKTGRLPEKLTLPQSSLAIGHTRWATHGGVTSENAHPHLSCDKQIAVVHNGIVENFQQLKENLVKKGHQFVSETDTEIVPHLIEENLKKLDFAQAVRVSFNQLTGLNAIVAVEARSNEIIAAKSGSPLVVGIGKKELYIASDAAGILKHTKKVVFLADGQLATLADKLQLIDLGSGKPIEPEITTLDWKFEETEKGEFKHFFLKEIYEQPRVLEGIATNNLDAASEFATLIKHAYGTFFIACGSASYAALAGTYLFSKLAKKHVNFAIGSEFNYLEDYITAGSLVIPISQSGESVDVTQPISRAKEKGATIAALVNVLGSTLYRQADHKLLLGAGAEKSVVATKSLTAMIANLILIAYSLVDQTKKAQELLLSAAGDVKSLLEEEKVKQIKNIAQKLKDKEHVYLLGRGLSYATALEATLKLKEASYTHAEGFAAGELKHGVISLIEKGTPVIVFAPNDETYEEIISNAAEVAARGGYIIGIGPKNNAVFATFLETADSSEATMIAQIIVSQLLAYYLALERGIADPDHPRNLAKSVTVK